MASDKSTLNALLRADLYSFIQRAFGVLSPGVTFMGNWHVEAMAHQLTRCYRGEINRLIITLPPRYLKSQTTSVAYAAWVLGNDPTRKIINVSYSESLVIKHHIDTRQIIESEFYRQVFPKTRLSPDKNSQTEFATTKGGHRLAVSVGGALTGRGGNLIIIDDPHKADEVYSSTKREATLNWYRNTLRTRLDNSNHDIMILIQQRLHENDLAGYLLETGEWEHLNLPALAEQDEAVPTGHGRSHLRKTGEPLHEARQSREQLDLQHGDMGSMLFAAQYQQRPVPIEGGLIQRRWLVTYQDNPAVDSNSRIVQSWDVACKAGETNDWSVCTTWLMKEGQCFLLDVLRKRAVFPELRKMVPHMAARWHATAILIEDSVAGTSLIQDIKADSRGLNVIGRLPKGGKEERLLAVASAFESGRVHIPESAPWLAGLMDELLRFPNGRFDDQVDSVTQFLQWERGQPRRKVDLSEALIVPSQMARQYPQGVWLADDELPMLSDGVL